MSADLKIQNLADWLEKQSQDSTISDGRIWQEMAVSERTFYRLKPKAILLVNSRAIQRQTELAHIKTQELKQELKQGLKSKSERVLYLQQLIEDIQTDLTTNKTVEIFVVSGSIQKVTRELTAMEKARMRKTIKDIQAEISQIEGDYAPKKVQDVTDYDVIVPGE